MIVPTRDAGVPPALVMFMGMIVPMRMVFVLVGVIVFMGMFMRMLVTMPMFHRLLVMGDDMKFRSADTGPPNGLAGDREFVQVQARKLLLELSEVSPGIEKGTDNHVAGRPGETVKIR